jgi:hypothetical protein
MSDSVSGRTRRGAHAALPWVPVAALSGTRVFRACSWPTCPFETTKSSERGAPGYAPMPRPSWSLSADPRRSITKVLAGLETPNRRPSSNRAVTRCSMGAWLACTTSSSSVRSVLPTLGARPLQNEGAEVGLANARPMRCEARWRRAAGECQRRPADGRGRHGRISSNSSTRWAARQADMRPVPNHRSPLLRRPFAADLTNYLISRVFVAPPLAARFA